MRLKDRAGGHLRYFIYPCISFLLSFSVPAQSFYGPEFLGKGKAGRASGSGPEALFVNPAAITSVKGMSVHGFYNRSSSGASSFAGSMVDNNSDMYFTGGISYVQQKWILDEVRYREEEWRVGVAKTFPHLISAGLVGKVFKKTDLGSRFNMDMGGLYAPMEWLGLAMTWTNFLGYLLPSQKSEISIAAQYNYQNFFHVNFDVTFPVKNNPKSRFILSMGSETRFKYGFLFRFGGRHDAFLEKNFIATGLGWVGPRLSLQWSIEKELGAKGSIAQVFDLGLFF